MSKFNFSKKKIDVSGLLTVLGNNAVNYFKIDTFNAQAFDGDKWKVRKVADKGRRLLVKTGHLRQSIRVIKKNSKGIVVGTDVPYAKYHNEGAKHIPKRKFIGKSERLNRINQKSINSFLKRAMAKK